MSEVCSTMEVTLNAVTPLFTGDENMRMTRLRPTGLLGSLRVWHEWIWAGAGHPVKDPTSGGDIYNLEKGETDISPSSRLFGCTGWGRRFRLVCSTESDKPVEDDKFKRDKPNGDNKKPAGGLARIIRLQFLFLHPTPEKKPPCWLEPDEVFGQILTTIKVACKFGGLGAKQVAGNGLCKYVSHTPDTIKPVFPEVRQGTRRGLGQMFSATVTTSDDLRTFRKKKDSREKSVLEKIACLGSLESAGKIWQAQDKNGTMRVYGIVDSSLLNGAGGRSVKTILSSVPEWTNVKVKLWDHKDEPASLGKPYDEWLKSLIDEGIGTNEA